MRGALFVLPTFATVQFQRFFDCGRAIRCLLPLCGGRFMNLVVLCGYQDADTDADQFALTEQLFDAALGELGVVSRRQPCFIQKTSSSWFLLLLFFLFHLPGWEEEEAAAPSASSSSTNSQSLAACWAERRAAGTSWASAPSPSAPPAHGTSGRRARLHRQLHLPTPPDRAGRVSACRRLRSVAGCGHSSAAQAPRGCPAAPRGVASVPEGRRSSRGPPPHWLRCLSSVPKGGVRLRTVVCCSRRSHGNAELLVPPGTSQPSLPPPPRGGPAVASSHHLTSRQSFTRKCNSACCLE